MGARKKPIAPKEQIINTVIRTKLRGELKGLPKADNRTYGINEKNKKDCFDAFLLKIKGIVSVKPKDIPAGKKIDNKIR
ncbi:hypothetical protein AA106555_0579 [Neokomagataea thailandica NBRC 106555]|uniref:Uncharacterized protein n=1 Tax=Neokomagataea thailandica NBRC 106555 TaxID=1223520 RepID=A0ABQ0QNI5_9PROT|nr:hypothetical protein AA106555_0579 [Neokomagataea thailandica NBRC 106555]